MSIPILCDQCHRRLQLPEEFIEEVVCCPVCGHTQRANESPTPPTTSTSRPTREAIDDSLIPASGLPKRPETSLGREEIASETGRRLKCPYCERITAGDATACVGCQAAVDANSLRAHLGRLQEARNRWGCVSLVLGLVGLWLGSFYFVTAMRLGDGEVGEEVRGDRLVLSLLGVGLFCCGLAAGARAKGESAKWGLLGLVALCCLIQPIWWMGCIALALPTFLVPDRNAQSIKRLEEALAQPSRSSLAKPFPPMPS